MPSALSRALHAAAFCWYALVLKSLMEKDEEQLPAAIFVYGGPWKYLTFLNLLLQMSFFGLATLNDLRAAKHPDSPLSRGTDLLFSVFVFPVGMFVVLLFWTIFAYDRELVYPASIDSFFPPWINHAMHSVVLPLLLAELLLQPHRFPPTRRALAALGAVGSAYLSWIVWVYLSVGVWVYPVMAHFSSAGLGGFFLVNMSVLASLYALGEQLNARLWREELCIDPGATSPRGSCS